MVEQHVLTTTNTEANKEREFYFFLFILGFGKTTGAFSIARFAPEAVLGSPRRPQSLSDSGEILQPKQWGRT